MMLSSRLSQRLERQIAEAGNPIDRACHRAEYAVLLMRHGHLAQAREDLTSLHQLAFQYPNPALGSWLHLAEGLISHYTDFNHNAIDKVMRAQAISRASGLQPMEALCSAWLSSLHYSHHELTPMVQCAAQALRLAEPDHHAARARVGLTIAQAYHYADRPREAGTWYGRVRSHASALGDDATLSHLIHNTAQLRTAAARRISLQGAVINPEDGLLLGADSISHFDEAVGGSAMDGLVPILRAQVLVVQGDFKQAQALYEAHLPQAIALGLARLGSSLLADLAWCRVNTGPQEQARQQAHEAELELDPGCDVDDRAATHARLAQVYDKLGDMASAERHRALAQTAWREFAAEQAEWLSALEQGLAGLE